MLQAHTGTAPPRAVRPEDEDAVWLDLLDPTEAERAQATRATGLALPTRAEVAEIESSSRLRLDGDVFTLSAPVIGRGETGPPVAAPIGFVLSPHRLVTLRWGPLKGLDAYAARLGVGTEAPGSVHAFVGLVEAMVDRLADVLEGVGAELDALSSEVFHVEGMARGRRRSQESAALRATLRRIGLAGDLVSRLRDSLLGLGRIVGFVPQAAAAWIAPELLPRFAALRTDISSLSDYDSQLTNKVQFLLDATLGFLNIEQNEGIKVLTVVSLVGIPPTLIASVYGMNFKNMPELNWAWGYPYALGLIALSVVGPMLFFKIRGWL